MADCKLRSPLENLNHFGDSLIDGLRTQRSAEHSDEKPIVGNAELFASSVARCDAIEGQQFSAHGCACNARVGQLGSFECHRAHVCETSTHPSRQTGSTVVTHDHNLYVRKPRRKRCREARIAAHRHNNGWAQLFQQGARNQRRSNQLERKSNVARGKASLQSHNIEKMMRIRRVLEQPRFDAATRSDIDDLIGSMAASDEAVGNRQSREHMARRATASNHSKRRRVHLATTARDGTR